MGKPRRLFIREFKVEAIKLVTEQGRSNALAVHNLGITENLLRKWKKALDAEGAKPSPTKAISLPSKKNYAACAPRTNGSRWNATF
jgi:transposase